MVENANIWSVQWNHSNITLRTVSVTQPVKYKTTRLTHHKGKMLTSTSAYQTQLSKTHLHFHTGTNEHHNSSWVHGAGVTFWHKGRRQHALWQTVQHCNSLPHVHWLPFTPLICPKCQSIKESTALLMPKICASLSNKAQVSCTGC